MSADRPRRWFTVLRQCFLGAPGEVLLLALWAAFVTRVYFVRDPNAIPVGVDFVTTTFGSSTTRGARPLSASSRRAYARPA